MQKLIKQSKTLAILLVFGLFMVIHMPAYAATIDAAGAERLKTLFTTLLDKKKEQITANNGTLTTTGEVAVKQASGYYTVTLPPIAATTADKITQKIGAIAINAVPTNDPNNWKMSIFVPGPIVYTDPKGTPVMQIDIGKQRTGGLWNHELQSFSKLSGQYQNIKLTNHIEKTVFNAERMNLTGNLSQSSDKTWSGPSKLSLSGLSLNSADNNIFSLAKADISMSVSGFDPKEKIEQIPDNPLTSVFKDRFDDANLSLAFNDFKFHLQKQDTPGSIQIKSGGLHYTKEKKDNGLSDRTFKINYDGLTSQNSEHRYQDIFPEKLKTLISLKNLPLDRIMTSLSGVYQKEFNNEGEQRLALLGIMMGFPAYFMESGTNVTVSETSFGNKLYNVIVDGKIETDSSAVLGLTGDISFKSKGLEDLESALTERAPTLSENQQIKLKRGVAAIKFLNETGISEGDYKNITVSLDKAAQVLVNGIDLDTVIARFTNLKVEVEETQEPAEETTSSETP